MVAKRMLALTVALFLTAGGGLVFGVEKVIEKSFPASPGAELILKSDRGSIRVGTGAPDKVDVRVTLEARGQDKAEKLFREFKLDFNPVAGGLKITGEGPEQAWKFWNWGSDNLNVHYEITVPKEYKVNLTTGGGSIAVSDLDGAVVCDTSGGSIKLGRIDGQVHARTSGGSITVEGGTAKVDVETSGGSIRIGDTGGPVRAHTSGGSIRLGACGGPVDADTSGGSIIVEEVLGKVSATTSGGSVKATITRQPEGDCRLETSGGSVTVYLAPSVRMDVSGHSSGGGVRVNVPFEGDIDDDAIEGKINGGGPKLMLSTSAGSVNVLKHVPGAESKSKPKAEKN